MNRADFCRAFAIKSGIPIEQGERVCKQVFDFLSECLTNECINHDGHVYIKGLGTFKGKLMKSRKVGNFNGGEPVILPERVKVSFDFSPPARTETNGDGALDIIIKQLNELPREELMRRLGYIAFSPVPQPASNKPTYHKMSRVAEPQTKTCLECGQPFVEIQKTQKYCCVACREKHYRDARLAFNKYYNSQTPSGNGRNVTINL